VLGDFLGFCAVFGGFCGADYNENGLLDRRYLRRGANLAGFVERIA